MLEKTYQPSEIEDRIYRAWEAAGAFDSGRPERKKAKPYCIVIPPPNVTGSLHMGHALNNTLQDVLCRFERMRGRDVLWQPGTDHAGIATQMVVERQLKERGEPDRRALGREEFVKRVWEWKAESGGTIIRQLKRLGASCDWRRERFTMDAGLSRAVLKVFVDLYKAKLIYKDKRLVNWDPKLLTAISDLEVQQVEVKGHLWYIKYPIEGLENTYIIVATTRPETMLGDVAVAVHPKNKRWKKFIGKHAILPLVGRRIPVIADDYADPEKGSGAVKITPAHDFNDFEVWLRHRNGELRGVEPISLFTPEAKLKKSEFDDFVFGHRGPGSPDGGVLADDDAYGQPTFELIPEPLRGLDRFEARKRIVEMLEAEGRIEKVEPTVHTVPHGDRSGVVVEPFLSEQWYVDAKTLAKDALAAVKKGRTKFVPKNWEKTYFEWLNKIEPWCISRQLWWGHQIPAWYGPDQRTFVAETEKEAIEFAAKYYETEYRDLHVRLYTPKCTGQDFASGLRKGSIKLHRDEDVLDTWFSSALWPFSTLGWPEKTPELQRYYPTSVLVTGFDIIFFWVARMMMMGLHCMKEVPFHTVYIHALVRDERGAKMSKSKGNVIDPLSIIDDYGADALRFTLSAMAAQGRDIKLAASRVEGYRNFATKLWNAARFAEINGCARDADFNPRSVSATLNRWALNEKARAARAVTKALEVYRFNEAADAIYRFVWNTFCDWYLELAKPVLQGPDGPAKVETQRTIAFILDEIYKLLHPFMPFITEELWQVTGSDGVRREPMLALASWPETQVSAVRSEELEIGWLIFLVTAIRSVRSEMNITNAIPLVLVGASPESKARAERWSEFVKRLARVTEISYSDVAPQGSVQLLVRGEVAALPLAGVIDLASERARLEKEMAIIASDIARIDAKLGNADFLARAPAEVVEGEREKREEAEGRRLKVREALARLKGAA